MSDKVVSVVIPVYNAELYIKECLDSVLAQTWEQLEIIVVDDGSTDGSLQYVREAAGRDPRITVIQSTNSGPSRARNIGLDSVTGDFVTFVDADDLIEPDYIDNMAKAIGDADFCLGGFQIWEQSADKRTFERSTDKMLEGEELQRSIGDYGKFVAGVGWRMFRTGSLQENNIRFPEGLCFSEDTLFFLNVLFSSKKGCLISDAGYIYRKHNENSLSSRVRFDFDMFNDILHRYCEFYLRSNSKEFREHIKDRVLDHLVLMGTVICFRKERYRIKKRVFWSLVDQNGINKYSWNIRVKSGLKRSMKMTLVMRMFIIYHSMVKIRYLFDGKRS